MRWLTQTASTSCCARGSVRNLFCYLSTPKPFRISRWMWRVRWAWTWMGRRRNQPGKRPPRTRISGASMQAAECAGKGKREPIMSSESVTGALDARRITTQTLQDLKRAGVPIAMLTAYDYTSARILDAAGVDVLLVGDSASNVIGGVRNDAAYHAGSDDLSCPVRHSGGAPRPRSSGSPLRILSGQFEGGVGVSHPGDERGRGTCGQNGRRRTGPGGSEAYHRRRYSSDGPSRPHAAKAFTVSAHTACGHRTRRKRIPSGEMHDCWKRRVVSALCSKKSLQIWHAMYRGSFRFRLSVSAPGCICDGQVLVIHDLLGLNTDFNPRFVRRYAHLEKTITEAVQHYVQDVRTRAFPSGEESY